MRQFLDHTMPRSREDWKWIQLFSCPYSTDDEYESEGKSKEALTIGAV